MPSLVGEDVVAGVQFENLFIVRPIVIVHDDEATLRFYKAADYQIDDFFPVVEGSGASAVLLQVIRRQKP